MKPDENPTREEQQRPPTSAASEPVSSFRASCDSAMLTHIFSQDFFNHLKHIENVMGPLHAAFMEMPKLYDFDEEERLCAVPRAAKARMGIDEIRTLLDQQLNKAIYDAQGSPATSGEVVSTTKQERMQSSKEQNTARINPVEQDDQQRQILKQSSLAVRGQYYSLSHEHHDRIDVHHGDLLS